MKDANRKAMFAKMSKWGLLRKNNQYEVRFVSLRGNDYSGEYGFEDSPPAIFTAKSKKDLVKMISPQLNIDRVKITSIKKVRW